MSDGAKVALFLGGLVLLGGLGYGLYRYSQKRPHHYIPTSTSPVAAVPQLPAAGASTVTTTTETSTTGDGPTLQVAPTPPVAHVIAPSSGAISHPEH
jgi:hypothetical protein